MLLEAKRAIVYGAGPIGTAVATAFAREGAMVHLASRDVAHLEPCADAIRAAGGTVTTAAVDVLDEAGLRDHAATVAADAGRIDIAICLVGVDDVQGTPLVDMTWEDFERPIHKAVRSSFLVVKAVAPHMVRQGDGVVLFFGGDGDPVPDYSIGGFQVALAAVESMRRQYASELGRNGVRFVSIRTGGIIDSFPPDTDEAAGIVDMLVSTTMLKRGATLEDLGHVAAFAASDRARTMTASTLNISCGALVD